MKHYFPHKISSLLLALLILLNVSCEKQPTKKSEIEKVRNSVISFTLRFKDGKKVETVNFGTGFFINEKYVATAWHVSRDLIKERTELGEKYVEIVIQKSSIADNSEFTVPVNFIIEDKENDLAIFGFESEDIKKQWKDFEIRLLPLSNRLPDIGEEIVSTGFFSTYIQPFSSVGTVAMISENEVKGGDVTLNQAIFSDLTTLSGHSGGPVYSFQTQNVVGVNNRILNPNNDKVRTAISTNSLHLTKLLNEAIELESKSQNTSL